jgi:CRISPR-associated endoribonuclease Cas6
MPDFVTNHIVINDYDLHTVCVQFLWHMQKGCIGTCSYTVKRNTEYASQVAALAEFARYAGIGYRTTMGMGQARVEECQVSV